MVISCPVKLEIGKIIANDGVLWDDFGIAHEDQPFVVLREATKEEWLAQYKTKIPFGEFFYLISLD